MMCKVGGVLVEGEETMVGAGGGTTEIVPVNFLSEVRTNAYMYMQLMCFDVLVYHVRESVNGHVAAVGQASVRKGRCRVERVEGAFADHASLWVARACPSQMPGADCVVCRVLGPRSLCS